MSVHRYETVDGTRWRVRWRVPGGKLRSQSFVSKREATAFDAEVKTRKRRMEPLPAPASYTLERAWEDWLRSRQDKRAAATIASHKSLWGAHIAGTSLAATPLALLSVNPQVVEDHLDALKAKDAKNQKLPLNERSLLGNASKRRLMMVLSAVFRRAVSARKIQTNPIREMEKPRGTPERTTRPFPPILIERIRKQVLAAGTEADNELGAEGYACLISLIAYGGLRPAEALALQVRDLGKNIITVDKALTQGAKKSKVGQTKTKYKRAVPLASPLASDLADWLNSRDNPKDSEPVIPSSSGTVWTHSMYRNWRRRVWKPAVKALAEADPNLDWLAEARPYDCRHSFVSLQLRAGSPPVEVAAAAGHSVEVMYRHYTEVIAELKGEPQLPAAMQIDRARQLLREEAPKEVADLTAESLKPPKEIPHRAQAILYGDYRRMRGGG